MTVEELVKLCEQRGISLTTQIALRAKDDHFLLDDSVYLGNPYFGNSLSGEAWYRKNAPRDVNGDIDYENAPQFLILDIE